MDYKSQMIIIIKIRINMKFKRFISLKKKSIKVFRNNTYSVQILWVKTDKSMKKTENSFINSCMSTKKLLKIIKNKF